MNTPVIAPQWMTVFSRLRDGVEQEEKSRSQYWDEELAKFSIDENGTVSGLNSMGTVSKKRTLAHMIAHWILLIPFRAMGWRFRGFGRHLRDGYEIAKRHGRLFTHDMLRQVLVISLIDHYLPLEKQAGCNLVIGDGYGVLTGLFLAATPKRKTIACNLRKSLLLDLLQVQKSSPDIGVVLATTTDELKAALADDTVSLIAVPADYAEIIKAAPVSVATNVHSMMEMDHAVIAAYFDILRENSAKQTAFYCANRLYKKLQGGTITRFMEYPWDPEDDVLHDGMSYWSQWNVNKAPPFLHYRFGKHRVVWHRLALLKMRRS